MTARCKAIVNSRWFDPLMLVVIVLNAIVLGAETYERIERDAGDALSVLNEVILGIFVVELFIRFGGNGLQAEDLLRLGLERLRLRRGRRGLRPRPAGERDAAAASRGCCGSSARCGCCPTCGS